MLETELFAPLGFQSVQWFRGQPQGRRVLSQTWIRASTDTSRRDRAPFVAAGRFPEEREPVGFSTIPPDLAVEVLSPSDRPGDVLEKVGEYLDVGTRLVWVIDPEKRRAVVYRSLTEVRVIGETDVLAGEDVVPGFACPLSDVLG